MATGSVKSSGGVSEHGELDGLDQDDHDGVYYTESEVDTLLDAKADDAATTAALAGKADTSHTHAQSDVTNLTTDLAAKALGATTITAGAGLTGGGDLSANRTLAVGAGTGITVNADDVAVNQSALKIDDFAAGDDNTDLDSNTTRHGLLLKATAPASGLLSVVGIGNGETSYALKALFDSTNPASLGTAAPGTELVAARRDHVHTLPKLDDLATPDDNTDLNASTSAHGLLKKLSNVSTEFMNGQGNWATPVSSLPTGYETITQNNENLTIDATKNWHRITAGSNAGITYISTTGVTAGYICWLTNGTFNPMAVTHNGGSAPAGFANIQTHTNANFNLSLRYSCGFAFDGTSWRSLAMPS